MNRLQLSGKPISFPACKKEDFTNHHVKMSILKVSIILPLYIYIIIYVLLYIYILFLPKVHIASMVTQIRTIKYIHFI